MKKIFKKLVLTFGYHLGIFEIIRIIFSKKGYVPILLYHQILDEVETDSGLSSFYLLGTGISKNHFERQIGYLKKKYNIVGLKEYIEKKENKENLAGLAVITFDDGFKNPGLNILKNQNVPATIFIIGDAFEKLCWSHRLCLLLDYAKVKTFTMNLTPGETVSFSLTNSKKKKEAVFSLIKIMRNVTQDRKDNLIKKIELDLMVEKKFRFADIYLNENDIKQLVKTNLSFGVHSMSHTRLDTLDAKDLEEEIVCSEKLLKKLTQNEYIPFSIPLGYYDDRVLETIRRKKFLCNLTSDDGLNGKDQDIYRLKRIYVNAHTFSEFVFKISGTRIVYQNCLKYILRILRGVFLFPKTKNKAKNAD